MRAKESKLILKVDTIVGDHIIIIHGKEVYTIDCI